MKHYKFYILLCIIIVANAMHAQVTYRGLEYCKSGNAVLLQSCKMQDCGDTLRIPEYIYYEGERLPVIGICTNAFTNSNVRNVIIEGNQLKSISGFRECGSLKSIKMPNSVTEVWDKAFYKCVNLKELHLSTNITKIGYYAFYNCSSLESISLPSIENISDYAFSNCGLISVTLPVDKNINLGEHVFASCRKLEKIENLENAKISWIPPCAFVGCRSLKSLTFNQETIKTIAEESFRLCTNLESITLPPNLTNIGVLAFECDSSLTKIVIPKSVLSINYYDLVYLSNYKFLFRGCNNLKSLIVDPENPNFDSRDNCNAIIRTSNNQLEIACISTTIPSSVESIASEAFYGLDIESITIPNSVKTMGEGAFSNCKKLASIHFGNGLSEIPKSAFISCFSLKYLNLPEGINVINTGAFAGCRNLKEAILPKSLYKMGEDVFGYDSCLETVKTGGIRYIPNKTFVGCFKLKSITFGDSVMSIGRFAFEGCKSLEAIRLKSPLANIDQDAFFNCTNLKTVYLPESVYDLGTGAFNKCVNLEHIYCRNTDVNNIYLGSNVFLDVPTETCTLHVPASAVEKYHNADQWKNFKNIVPIETIKGDVCEDGLVDVRDVTVLISGILGNAPAEYNDECADVNNDGTVDVKDVTALINLILN